MMEEDENSRVFASRPLCRTRLLRSGGDFLDVHRFLRRIEFAGQHHVRSGEVLNSFRVFDNPDGLILASHKDGSLGFPFRMTYRITTTPSFLHAIRATGLGVFGRTRLVADPTGPRGAPLPCRDYAERCEGAHNQEKKSNPAPNHLFLPMPPQPAFTGAQ